MNRDERPSGSGPHLAAAGPDPMVGQILDGRYRLVDKLGEGGMGEVYRAEHVHIEKRVAIKLLRNEILTNQEAVSRFRQEARSASSIGHKNIIAIEDFGQLPDGRIYLAMELLQGTPLSDLILTPVSPERLVNIMIQTGHGLAAAHKKGIIHRDMKPENIFVTVTGDGDDVPKLLDFGIAKVSGADGNNHLTRTGTIFGTPFYMAPEQALGQNVDARADVYAMGVIMYETFCGAVPFQGESFMGILTQHITAEPKPPSRMAAEHGKVIPPGIEEIILRAMRKDQEQRYQNMDELVQALVVAYRGLAGAGMSSYMHAHPVSGGHSPPPGSMPVRAAATPMPYQQHADSSSPYHMPHPPPSGGYAPPHQPLTPLPMSPADSISMPRRSKAPLIAVILLLLLGGGGAAAYFLFFNKQEDDSSTTAKNTPPPVDDGKAVVPPPATADAAPAVVPPPVTVDAGAKPVVKIDKPVVKPDKPPKAELVTVLVNSRPQGADIIGADGKKVGATPWMIKVEKGKPRKLTLKKRRFKDVEITVDGSQEKVSHQLDRERAGRPGRPDPGPDEPPDVEEPPPSKDPCVRAPKSIECRCSKDSSLPECGLE
jgi:serine/threonine protein kinase